MIIIPDAGTVPVSAVGAPDTRPAGPRRTAWRPVLIALHAAATLAALVACLALAYRAGRDRDLLASAGALTAWFVTVVSGVLLGAWFGLLGDARTPAPR